MPTVVTASASPTDSASVTSASRTSAVNAAESSGAISSPDRWLLWLGLLFVLSVYHFPTGVVGRLRAGSASR